ncbi:MAG: hypothetical protein Fur0037_00800 [Planctomycetota bacterium]
MGIARLALRGAVAPFLALASLLPAQSTTTLDATAPGGKNTVTFDLNHNVSGIVSVTVNGAPAKVDSKKIEGTKVIVTFGAPAPGAGDVVKVVVEYSGTEPKVQDVTWSSS